jgi:uncharacterized radical SAM superfamily protein
MAEVSAEAIWNATPQQLQQLLDSDKLVSQNKKIRFYAPSFTYYKTASFCGSTKEFPTISVTGNGCALNCKHCGGKVLETMHAAQTPEKLLTLCRKLKQDGALGVLVSGGCLPDGSVPLDRFMPTLAQVKRDLALTVFVHTGIVDAETARQLKQAGVDAALIDVIGSDQTIQEIYNLNVSAAQYEASLKALHQAGIPFVPHIIVGLHHGNLKGEYTALKMIKPYKPSAVVVISFMPIHGTTMAQTTPPNPINIARTAAVARVMFPQTPLVLGCMRPKGKHRTETDVLALKAGVDGIAFPSETAIEYSKKMGFEVGFSKFCCAQIYRDLAGK